MLESSLQDLPGGTAMSASSSDALSVMNSIDITTFALEMRACF